MLMRSGLESGTVAYRRTDAATQRQRRATRHFRRSSRARRVLPERTPRDHSRGPRAPSSAPRARRRQVCAGSRLRRRRGQPDPAGRALRSRDAAAVPHRRRATPARARRVPATLMEFQDVVRKRKMVRSFEDRPIPREAVERIVANVQRAPSAGFSQGWGFLVLEGKEDTARYWDANWPKERRADWGWPDLFNARSEEHTSELQSRRDLVCRLLLEKKK